MNFFKPGYLVVILLQGGWGGEGEEEHVGGWRWVLVFGGKESIYRFFFRLCVEIEQGSYFRVNYFCMFVCL